VPQGKNLRVHRGDTSRPASARRRDRWCRTTSWRSRATKRAELLLREIQTVYRAQGVSIDDKHIEIILAR
jgi:hypothetical protein